MYFSLDLYKFIDFDCVMNKTYLLKVGSLLLFRRDHLLDHCTIVIHRDDHLVPSWCDDLLQGLSIAQHFGLITSIRFDVRHRWPHLWWFCAQFGVLVLSNEHLILIHWRLSRYGASLIRSDGLISLWQQRWRSRRRLLLRSVIICDQSLFVWRWLNTVRLSLCTWE